VRAIRLELFGRATDGEVTRLHREQLLREAHLGPLTTPALSGLASITAADSASTHSSDPIDCLICFPVGLSSPDAERPPAASAALAGCSAATPPSSSSPHLQVPAISEVRVSADASATADPSAAGCAASPPPVGDGDEAADASTRSNGGGAGNSAIRGLRNVVDACYAGVGGAGGNGTSSEPSMLDFVHDLGRTLQSRKLRSFS